MNLTSRKPVRSAPVVPQMKRYKHYQVDCEEEEAIQQAEICLDLLSSKMAGADDERNRMVLLHNFDVLRKMRLSLASMGATRTTMGYN
jgi:hypothetical protein